MDLAVDVVLKLIVCFYAVGAEASVNLVRCNRYDGDGAELPGEHAFLRNLPFAKCVWNDQLYRTAITIGSIGLLTHVIIVPAVLFSLMKRHKQRVRVPREDDTSVTVTSRSTDILSVTVICIDSKCTNCEDSSRSTLAAQSPDHYEPSFARSDARSFDSASSAALPCKVASSGNISGSPSKNAGREALASALATGAMSTYIGITAAYAGCLVAKLPVKSAMVRMPDSESMQLLLEFGEHVDEQLINKALRKGRTIARTMVERCTFATAGEHDSILSGTVNLFFQYRCGEVVMMEVLLRTSSVCIAAGDKSNGVSSLVVSLLAGILFFHVKPYANVGLNKLTSLCYTCLLAVQLDLVYIAKYTFPWTIRLWYAVPIVVSIIQRFGSTEYSLEHAERIRERLVGIKRDLLASGVSLSDGEPVSTTWITTANEHRVSEFTLEAAKSRWSQTRKTAPPSMDPRSSVFIGLDDDEDELDDLPVSKHARVGKRETTTAIEMTKVKQLFRSGTTQSV